MDLTPPNIQNLEDVKVYLERVYEYMKWIGNLQCQYMEWQDVDSPETPDDGRARIYLKTNDVGRSDFVAKFPTGVECVIASEAQPQSHIPDATTDHSSITWEGLFTSLDALGAKINSVLIALEEVNILESS